MATFYITDSPPTAPQHGQDENHPWSIQQMLVYAPRPGDTFRFRGGGTFPLALEWWGIGDPDHPITLTSYGPGRPTIQSGDRRALWYGGPGGLIVRGLTLQGGGEAGIEVHNNPDEGGTARNYLFEDVEARGYGSAGIALTANTLVEQIRIKGCNLHGNANGIAASGAQLEYVSGKYQYTGVNVLRDMEITDTDCSDNVLPNAATHGNGMSLVGIDILRVVYNKAFRNGSVGGQGHSGITAQQCRDVEIAYNHLGGTLPGPHGDGQNAVCNGCVKFDVHHNTMTGGNIGASAHDDRQDFGPHYPSRRGRIRNNVIVNPVVGIQVYRTLGDIWIEDNDIHVHAEEGEYRKCFSFDGPHDGRIFVRGNVVKAAGDSKAMGAYLLEAAYGTGLRDVWFGGRNTWEWEAWNHQPFRVLGRDYATLAEAARG